MCPLRNGKDWTFVSLLLNLLSKKHWFLHEKTIIRGKRFVCCEFSLSLLRINKEL